MDVAKRSWRARDPARRTSGAGAYRRLLVGFGFVCRLAGTGLLLIFSFLILPLRASADGGLVFLQRSQDELVLTLFATALPIRAGANDLSVLVQLAADHNPVLDAKVELSLFDQEPVRDQATAAWVPPACRNDAPPQLSDLDLPRGSGANRLYYSRSVTIPRAGRWLSVWRVKYGARTVEVPVQLVVQEAPLPLSGYWLYVALPFVAILVFGLWKIAVRQRTGTSPVYRPRSSGHSVA
jgi:hypothetical protein